MGPSDHGWTNALAVLRKRRRWKRRKEGRGHHTGLAVMVTARTFCQSHVDWRG